MESGGIVGTDTHETGRRTGDSVAVCCDRAHRPSPSPFPTGAIYILPYMREKGRGKIRGCVQTLASRASPWLQPHLPGCEGRVSFYLSSTYVEQCCGTMLLGGSIRVVGRGDLDMANRLGLRLGTDMDLLAQADVKR